MKGSEVSSRSVMTRAILEPQPEESVTLQSNGENVPLSNFLGKSVLLVVNVASQYNGLNDLYAKYRSRGFEILAFPCNQFGGQEPGSNAEIRQFTAKYGVEFPVFDKISVNGPTEHPFFSYLKGHGPDDLISGFLGKDIKW